MDAEIESLDPLVEQEIGPRRDFYNKRSALRSRRLVEAKKLSIDVLIAEMGSEEMQARYAAIKNMKYQDATAEDEEEMDEEEME